MFMQQIIINNTSGYLCKDIKNKECVKSHFKNQEKEVENYE